MKKYLLSFAVMLTGASLLTGCLNDNDSDSKKNQTVVMTTGCYVINSGQFGQNNGSMTYFDYESLQPQQVLQGANGLGDTPNDAYTYGDTIFVAGANENTIFLISRKNLSIIDQVSTTETMGETEGYYPNHIIGYDGNVYFTTYGGYVGVMSVKNPHSVTKIKVGSAPEGLCFGGTNENMSIYVANSDYGYGNASISKISMKDYSVTEIKNEKIQNPQEIVAVGDDVYFIDWGHYTEDYSKQLDAGLYHISGSNVVNKVIADATGMGEVVYYYYGAAVGYEIVTFNNPYGSESKPTYTKFNTYDGSLSTLTLSGNGDGSYVDIVSPAASARDPLSGNILIASRQMDPDTNHASFTLPGYVNIYNGSGLYIKNSHFTTGIEPHAIGFTIGTKILTVN